MGLIVGQSNVEHQSRLRWQGAADVDKLGRLVEGEGTASGRLPAGVWNAQITSDCVQ